MNFLDLFNRLARLAKPAAASELVEITDPQGPLKDTGIDSLDMLMITVYLCEIFGIPEEVGKNLKPASVAEVEAFVQQHKTRDFGSVEEALAAIT
jgi:acyl carrier protein